MKRINEILVVTIFILTAVLAAAVGFKAYDVYDTNRRLEKEQEEMEVRRVFVRNQEAQNRVMEMEAEFQELTGDVAGLEQLITKIQNGGQDEAADGTVSMNGTVSENMANYGYGTVSENIAGYGYAAVSGNAAASYGTVSGNAVQYDRTVSGNAVLHGFTVSGNIVQHGYETVSENGMLSDGAMIFGNRTVSANGTVSGNRSVSDNFPKLIPDGVSANREVNYYDGTMTESSIFDAWRDIYEQPDGMSLAQRRELRTSLQETLEVNQSDRERIAENKYDFSGLKIACLGDSITAASNLEKEENYQQYSYPARLKELLGAEEVYNLGIGGSSIGRYWSEPYVERYQEIPEDTDVIIVMGGTNDGFCVSDQEFGNLEERAYRTFCGDLDELMRGLHENYPDAEIFFATPLPNVLQDYLMTERDYLLPQQQFADTILTLAREYDYEVIDLYNSNILDSHDANVVAEYIPDGVHGSHAGYQVMAEHFAAQIIEHYDLRAEGDAEGAEDATELEEAEGAEDATESEEAEGAEDAAESGDAEDAEDAAESEEADHAEQSVR